MGMARNTMKTAIILSLLVSGLLERKIMQVNTAIEIPMIMVVIIAIPEFSC
jgi:hypothetical protein